jgi:signal transduction histidine kinase
MGMSNAQVFPTRFISKCCLSVTILWIFAFSLHAQTPFNETQIHALSPDVLRELEKETVNKSNFDILGLANSNSFQDLPKAIAYVEIALKKAQKKNNLRDIFESRRDLGFIYEDNILFKEALIAYQQAAVTAEMMVKISPFAADSAKMTIFTDIALTNKKIGNYHESYKFHNRTLELAEKVGDKQMIDDTYHNLGILHQSVGDYDKALDYLFKSLSISETRKDGFGMMISHGDIGETYLKTKNIEKALMHIEKAEKIGMERLRTSKRFADSVQLASELNKFGLILTTKGDFQGALRKHESALGVYKSIHYKSYIAQTLINIADVYLQQKQIDVAEQKFLECLEYEPSLLSKDIAILYFKMGDLYQRQNKMPESELAFEKSLKVAQQYAYKEIAQKCNYQLFLLLLGKRQNRQALMHLQASNALNDSLFNEEKIRRTAEMELKFDAEKREKDIRMLQLREKEMRLRENTFILVSSVLAFALVLGFMIYTIRLRGKNFQALKAKNEEIQRQYQKLEETNELLRQFAYVAAHDLKEPLRSIGSYISLIQIKYGKQLDGDASKYMGFVNAGVKRMYSLLTDLLDFSRVLAQQPDAEITRPEEVIADVAANLSSAIEDKNATILYPDKMPSLQMNRLHLTQLFQNLIGNAIKFTEDRPPIVTIKAGEEPGAILLSIADNGIGIKKEYEDKVFVLFQQLNKNNRFEGTGIGLTICKNIVEKYNGKIWFDSAENEGTTFYIRIPAQAA